MRSAILAGPTACGKSKTAIRFAKLHPEIEVVNADSVSAYRDADIGAAKPSQSEMREVPHHLVGILGSSETFTAGEFVRQTHAILDSIHERGKRALIVGGSNFYLKALRFGLWEAPPAQPEIRERLREFSNDELFKRLQRLDPKFRVSSNDRYRLVRALEIIESSGELPSVLESRASKEPDPDFPLLWIDRSFDEMLDRIRERTHWMLDAGLIDEVKSIPRNSSLHRAIGYAQTNRFLAGEKPDGRKLRAGVGGLYDEIVLATRQLVKRQRTWGRSTPNSVSTSSIATTTDSLKIWTESMPNKPTVVITYPFHKEVIREKLKTQARVVHARNQSELKLAIRKADGLITLLYNAVDESLLKHAQILKVVGNMAVGYDNIDLMACKKRGIKVVNTPGVLTRSTAELTLTLLFATARRLFEGESLCRKNAFKGWQPDMLLGLELKGRRAIIVGAGRIGKETARLFRALGLKVEFITKRDREPQIRSKMARAQILSIHLPLNSNTKHYLNRRRIGYLKSDCIVLNSSRGPLIEEKALISALRKKKLWGAGLDVFEREPSIPKQLRDLKNVTLLPHLGLATQVARRGMAEKVVSGVLDVLRGRRPPNLVLS